MVRARQGVSVGNGIVVAIWESDYEKSLFSLLSDSGLVS